MSMNSAPKAAAVPPLGFSRSLRKKDGMLTTVQPTEVYIVSHEDEDAKEVHLRSEDTIEEKLANRMDKCEI
jgi:hypothetical protein